VGRTWGPNGTPPLSPSPEPEHEPERGGGRGGGKWRSGGFDGGDGGSGRGRDDDGGGGGGGGGPGGRGTARSPSPVAPPRRRRTGFDQAPDADSTAAAAASLVANLAQSTTGMDAMGRLLAQQQATKQLTALQATGVNVQATRHARRVYVGGISVDVEEAALSHFMEKAMEATGATKQPPGVGCVVSVYTNREKLFAFVEFRTVEEASNSLAFDGLIFQGQALRLRRPNDYNVTQAALLGPTTPDPRLNLAAIGIQAVAPGAISQSTENSNSPFKLFLGGVPGYLSEDQVRELVQSFGLVKAFNLVKDKETGLPKGYGFFEYADPAATEAAIRGLNGMRLGDKMLTLKLAGPGAAAALALSSLGSGAEATTAAYGHSALSLGGEETPCVRLKGMVTRGELLDPKEAAEILEDTEEECRGFGSLVKVLMPLPGAGPGAGPGADPPGVGEVLLRFADVESARRAQRSLNGRKFADRMVGATFVSEAEFNERDTPP